MYTGGMPFDVAAQVIREHAAVGRLQRPRARRSRDCRCGDARPVRHGEGRGGSRPAAPATILGLRSAARRSGRRDRRSRCSTSASAFRRTALSRTSRATPSRVSVRSARHSPSSIRPAEPGWSPAASALRHSRRWPRRCAPLGQARRCSTAPDSGAELFYLDLFRDLGVELVLTTEDGSVGERGRIIAPLDRRLAALGRGRQPVMIYACGPEGMLAAVRQTAASIRASRARSRSNASWGAGWAAATAASCPCEATMARYITSDRASPGRCCLADQILWD